MEVKSFTYRKSLFGTYYKQGLLNVQKMDAHIARMLSDGWEVLMTSPSFCTTANERVYITAIDCEPRIGGTRGLQAAGAGGL